MMVSISSTIIAIMIAILIVNSTTTARELRPSDHGLEYQGSPPPSTTSQQMKSFFKGSSSMSSPSSTSDNNFALPRAMNSTDTSWWSDGGGGGRDRVKHVMLIASVVCGATGVSLLVVSAFIYFMRYRTPKPSPSSLSLVPSNTNNTK